MLTLKANYLAQQPDYEVYIIANSLKGRTPAFRLHPSVTLVDLGIDDHVFVGRYCRHLNKALKEISADICISMGGTELFCLPNCTDGSIKISEFHFSHDKFFLKYGSSAIGRLYASYRTARLERAVSRLDAFVVLTCADRDDWRRRVSTCVEQIYNPLTFTSEHPAALDSHRCIAVGRLEPQKNYPDMIRAWKKVTETHPDWILEIYGEGRQKEVLAALIDSLGIDGKVILRGRSDSIRNEMENSSCLVLSSTFEGFPMVLLEASACGLPMVSYDCPCGPSEIISDGKNGFIVSPGDSDGLADAICQVISDEALRKRMGENALETSHRFGMGDIMSCWDSLFRKLIYERR